MQREKIQSGGKEGRVIVGEGWSWGDARWVRLSSGGIRVKEGGKEEVTLLEAWGPQEKQRCRKEGSLERRT